MLEPSADLPLQVSASPGLSLRLWRAGPPARELRLLRGQVLADRSDGVEDSLVQLVRGDGPGEAVEGPIEVVGPDALGRRFFPGPPPSSGWWRRGQRPDGRARDANWRSDREVRPPPLAGRPGPRPDGCSGPGARP